MIIVSGFNVYPTEVEANYRHPAVLKVCAVARSTTGPGARQAYIVAKDGATVTARSSRRGARDPAQGLTGYRVPKEGVPRRAPRDADRQGAPARTPGGGAEEGRGERVVSRHRPGVVTPGMHTTQGTSALGRSTRPDEYPDGAAGACANAAARSAWPRWGIVVVAGLFNLLGVRTETVSTAADGYHLTVRYEAVTRPGLASEWIVVVGIRGLRRAGHAGDGRDVLRSVRLQPATTPSPPPSCREVTRSCTCSRGSRERCSGSPSTDVRAPRSSSARARVDRPRGGRP